MDLFFLIEYINQFINTNYYFSIILFFSFIFLYSSLSIPGLLIFLVFAGYAFGIFWGFVISSLAVSLGSYIFFVCSKFFLRKIFKKIYNKYSQSINNFIKNSTLEYLVIFRLIPGPPLMVQNIILSLLNISALKFISATIIGFTPSILLSVLVGNKLSNIIYLENINTGDIFTIDFLLIITLFISIIVIRIIIKKIKKPSE